MPRTAETIAVEIAVRALADGCLSSTQIAEKLGLKPQRVKRLLAKRGLPRRKAGPPTGERNAAYKGGRRIDHSGYALVTAPAGHPYACYLKGKHLGYIREHRLVMERKLGRYLTPTEVVDHIDGLTLHNHPDNLRLYQGNGEHLRETLTGRAKNLSEEGRQSLRLRWTRPEGVPPVDTYRRRKAAGAIRLHQILLVALKLGTDSPYLVGTRQHTKKAEIDLSSRSTIERALADLCQQWGLLHIP